MDVRAYNRDAWDRLVEKQDRWTTPVSSDEIKRARKGDWHLVLTPNRPVPKNWYPDDLKGTKVLCLACGGGQQGPILSALGAEVIVFDNSPKQLQQDQKVAEREGLSLKVIEGDMKDLSIFTAESFDFIFHPCSNTFVENIIPVWKECFRVLKPEGILISGFINPLVFLFDIELEKQGILQMRYTMPYSDITSLSKEEREKYFGSEPIEFAHSLEEQIGGQTKAGFHIVDFYEDDWGGSRSIDKFIKAFIATKAIKPTK